MAKKPKKQTTLYSLEDLEAFVETQNEYILNEWYCTERSIAEGIMKNFIKFLNNKTKTK